MEVEVGCAWRFVCCGVWPLRCAQGWRVVSSRSDMPVGVTRALRGSGWITQDTRHAHTTHVRPNISYHQAVRRGSRARRAAPRDAGGLTRHGQHGVRARRSGPGTHSLTGRRTLHRSARSARSPHRHPEVEPCAARGLVLEPHKARAHGWPGVRVRMARRQARP